MHPDFALLTNISVALLAAFAAGLGARVIGLPTMVGYLLAGLLIGPFTPGFVGDVVDIGALAELGVIFMLFGVGLHFSLKDLWAVRRVAIPGAILQMVLATLVGLGVSRLWGWSLSAGLVLGLAISIASTVVLVRALMDHGLLNTDHGQAAVGWLIMEDLATVAILVLMPALAGGTGTPWRAALGVVVGTVVFVALMLFIGKKLLPWVLMRIAFTRSRELFILAVVALALGTALGAAELFGVSLALGAFLAGVVIGESDLSHQAGADILPLREVFTVIFFVSVGMLVDPVAVVANWLQVLTYTTIVVVGKVVITLLLGLLLPVTLKTIVVVAAGLSQIGEFSFLLGQAGLKLGLLSSEQYGMILATALLSILLNPFVFRATLRLEPAIGRLPFFRAVFRRRAPSVALHPEEIAGHVVVVGYGRVGEHIVTVLQRLEQPCLIVEQDAPRAIGFRDRGVHTLFGDAANSEVLTHANLPRARALVVTIRNEADTEMIVAAARALAPELPIVARAATRAGVNRLIEFGAHDVIHPELEGGLEVVRHTLLRLDYPMMQVQEYIDTVRRDSYDASLNQPEEVRLLDQLVNTVRGITITWRTISPESQLVGQSIFDASLRARTGASIIALARHNQMMANPKSSVVFEAGDLLGMLGDVEQIAAAERIIAYPGNVAQLTVHEGVLPQARSTSEAETPVQ